MCLCKVEHCVTHKKWRIVCTGIIIIHVVRFIRTFYSPTRISLFYNTTFVHRVFTCTRSLVVVLYSFERNSLRMGCHLYVHIIIHIIIHGVCELFPLSRFIFSLTGKCLFLIFTEYNKTIIIYTCNKHFINENHCKVCIV